MSELINNTSIRQKELYAFAAGMAAGEKGTELVQKYREAIDAVRARDVIYIVDRLVKDKIPMEKLKPAINKILNMFHKGLKAVRPQIPENNLFVIHLMEENRELEKRLHGIRPLFKAINETGIDYKSKRILLNQLSDLISELKEFDPHYTKKENILFPYLEKTWPDYRCLSVMWSFHDDIRSEIKQIIHHCHQENLPDFKIFNRLIGDLFFHMYAIIFREEYILFPEAVRAIIPKDWDEMYEQAFDFKFSYIDSPQKPVKKVVTDYQSPSSDGLIDLETGKVSIEQLIQIFNHMPADVSFIDQHDEVRFYSDPPHRIFPRSKAVIGRKVHNCHPPESVAIVEELLESFKKGEKNHEWFWIQMQGKFLLIRYYAVRNAKGEYMGTIEVSEDITEIRKLDGQKRLLG
ncbi:MAG: DUF438 domain-containing protein [Bacteroidales bacterium]|nr:DUF438 domain-containing protein [Bacteroidales bacterium]